MEKFLTDLHTHTTFSYDGKDSPAKMLEEAQKRGVSFYGVSDHFDLDGDASAYTKEEWEKLQNGDTKEYFHALRHLQEDYAGVMNVFVGAEFGFSEREEVKKRYVEIYEKYKPDFVINSIHCDGGRDYAYSPITQDKQTLYGRYLRLIRESLDAPYPYDIVGHIGYVMRYAPFDDKDIDLNEFKKPLDDILTTIIQKDKILEVNTASKQLETPILPTEAILKRYFELGGRKISFGSDAHFVERIMEKRELALNILKKIGFTYLTVPCKGEHIKVEI